MMIVDSVADLRPFLGIDRRGTVVCCATTKLYAAAAETYAVDAFCRCLLVPKRNGGFSMRSRPEIANAGISCVFVSSLSPHPAFNLPHCDKWGKRVAARHRFGFTKRHWQRLELGRR